MRILLINHEFPPIGGGAATAAAHIAKEMRKLGARVTVLTSAHAGLPAHEEREGCDILRLPALRKRADSSNVLEMVSFLLSSLWWAARHSARHKADVCIAFFGLPAGPAAWFLKTRHGTPYIISLRGGDVPGFLPEVLRNWHRLSGGLIRFLWRKAAFVVANSQGLAALAGRSLPLLRIPVIPNGVDTAWPAYAPPLDAGASTEVRLIATGRLNIQKNYPCLLRALAAMRETNWTLEIIGDGPERGALQNLARELGIAGRVFFRGWLDREDLRSRLAKADMYVFPSLQEGMPNTLLEAMAAGLPVVASKVTGCEELVIDGETGVLTPPDDVLALRAAMARLMGSPETRVRMGLCGQKRVQEHYTWPAAAAAYLALCRKSMED
jgi:glycosyltransferase involved in cell wall biosynthesis